MKRIEEKSYYEILEVQPEATAQEIQKAYDRAKQTFQDDSSAVHSLFSEKEKKRIQAAIEKAYQVLMNDALQKNYDPSHASTFRDPQGEKRQVEEEVHPEQKISLSFTDLAIHIGDENYRGKTLKQIRERMGIDLKAISKKTKINKKILEWIEEEAVENLPALVYLKGFLKGYAQSLDLDPQKVVEEYLQFLSQKKKK
jgi:DnaJ-class molecular chaperone